jgi:hypothetical protein
VRLRTVARRATRKRAKRGWRKVSMRPLFTCGACGKSYSNPLGHVCGNAGDFGKRRWAQKTRRGRRRAEAEAGSRAPAGERARRRGAQEGTRPGR